jgi:hypothetical protein
MNCSVPNRSHRHQPDQWAAVRFRAQQLAALTRYTQLVSCNPRSAHCELRRSSMLISGLDAGKPPASEAGGFTGRTAPGVCSSQPTIPGKRPRGFKGAAVRRERHAQDALFCPWSEARSLPLATSHILTSPLASARSLHAPARLLPSGP